MAAIRSQKSSSQARVLAREEHKFEPGPPLLWQEFMVGAVPQALTLSSDGKRTSAKSHVSLLHRRFILWAKAQGFSSAQMALVTGISERMCAVVVDEARDDSRKFSACDFVMRVLGGRDNDVVRYLDRYCGVIFREQLKANDCASYHLFGER